jgi:leucyl-tRNA synthetase
LHLIYSRFFCKVMRDLGLVELREPVRRLFSQGMVLKDGAKMSKSKGNLVGAIDMADKYGCDTARMYTLFAAPPEKDLEWNEQGIEGCARFLQRVFRLVDRHAATARDAAATHGTAPGSAKEKDLRRKAHQVLRRVTQDFEARWHFNTSVALIMELVNALYAEEPLEENIHPEVIRELLDLLTLMLAPMAPHLAEELWAMLGHTSGIVGTAWPEFSAELAEEEQVEVVIQVNGRMRAKILVDVGLGEAELVELALADPKVAQFLNGSKIVKRIVVPNKLVNLVVKANHE